MEKETLKRKQANSNGDPSKKLKAIRAILAPVFCSGRERETLKLAYEFPKARSIFFDAASDYTELPVLRQVLNKWHSRGLISFPPFVLELCSLFLHCINTTVIRCQKNSLDMVHTRSYFQAMVACLGWIYANGYDVPMVDQSQKNSHCQIYFSSTEGNLKWQWN